jgi:hypothetical protein
MDLKKYKRLFAFGCSFTSYFWPTWADLLKKEIPNTYIYAKIGAGNFFIYQAVAEAILKYNIDKDDLVMVMFSNVTREDRYTREQGWITPGNLFYQDMYDKEFLSKFFCEKGYLMRDLSLVMGIDAMLQHTKAEYHLMSIVPFDSLKSDQNRIKNVDDVLLLYKSILDKIKPSMFDVVFNGDWNNRKKRPKYRTHWAEGLYTDNHPTPEEHIEFLQATFPNINLQDNTISLAKEYTDQLLKCDTHQKIIDTFNDMVSIPEKRL